MGEPTCGPLRRVADVGMVQRGQDSGFTLKPCESIRNSRKRFRQDLQRHLPVQLRVGGLIDLFHAPLADEGGHVVAPYALESHVIRPETDEVLVPAEARA